MELKEMFCPECGKKTKIDTSRANNYCQNCGYQIKMPESKVIEVKESKENLEIDIEEKLEEVKFYYQTSVQKKEMLYKEKNPTYYLKAQDLLLELSGQIQTDYRVWWELSKPLDYQCEKEANDYIGQFGFNDEYFDKALELADIQTKKKLIQKREAYEQEKEILKSEHEAKEEIKRKQIAQEKEKVERKLQEENEQKKQIESRTVRGVIYPTIDKAEVARREHRMVDDLKQKLLETKSKSKQKNLILQSQYKFEIQESKKRYELLKEKVCVPETFGEKANKWYGISVLITFVLAILIGELLSGIGVVLFIWSGFGVYIWPIWKIILMVKNRRQKVDISNI